MLNRRRGKMSSESKSNQQSEHELNIGREYLKDYLRSVYGVSMSGARSIRTELMDAGHHAASCLVADEFLFRLLARFNDLDIAPCDGFISMAELVHAINVPHLYFDADDLRMLHLLQRYFPAIQDICAVENTNEGPHDGVSRHDLEILSTSETKGCAALRKRLNDEFSVKERA
jgi:hypothetical protein